MESEFAGLSLDDEEEEILQAQGDSDSVNNEEFLSLLGKFIGIFQEYDGSSLGKENMNFMRIRVQ
ncbi:hypothetical protein Gotur_029059, partial [Gossypium turneri]